MKVYTFDQGSAEWFNARAGIPTASEFDQLVTPDFAPRKGEMPKSYLAKKVAEAWQGGPILTMSSSFWMEQGNILEDQALPWYELQFNEEVRRPGFITTDDGRIGCSPDGLVGEDYGLEIKCPMVHTHTKWILDGEVPKEHRPQIQGGLLVTGLEAWKFISYCRHFPPMVKVIEPDEAAQEALREALESFLEDFDKAMKRMEEINGGPRPQRKSRFETPQEDIKDIYA